MFLTPKQTGGPLVFSLYQQPNRPACKAAGRYLALEGGPGGGVRVFDIEYLARALGRGLPAALQAGAGDTRQEHASLILLACCGGRLFEWLNSGGE